MTTEHGLARVIGDGLELTRLSDEHGWLKVAGDSSPRIGDRVMLVPSHVDPCLNLHDVLFAWVGEASTLEAWPIDGRRTGRGGPADERRAKRISSATVASAAATGPDRAGARPRVAGAAALGPAVTVRAHPGDNLAVHLAVARAAAGSVVVVGTDGEHEVAFAGDLVVRAAARRGVAGIVIDGPIRDRAEIADMRFPVFHRGTSPRGPTKRFPGEVQVPIELGGVPVSPGDLVCVDDDGLVVSRGGHRRGVGGGPCTRGSRGLVPDAGRGWASSMLRIFGIPDPQRDD